MRFCGAPPGGAEESDYVALSGTIGFVKVLEQAEAKVVDKDRVVRLIEAFESVKRMDLWTDAPTSARQFVCDDLLRRLKAAVGARSTRSRPSLRH
jgi:hypothetical protein